MGAGKGERGRGTAEGGGKGWEGEKGEGRLERERGVATGKGERGRLGRGVVTGKGESDLGLGLVFL